MGARREPTKRIEPQAPYDRKKESEDAVCELEKRRGANGSIPTMNQDLSISIIKRSDLLKPFLLKALKIIVELVKSDLPSKIVYPVSISSLIYPWLFQKADEFYDSEKEKSLFLEFNVNGEEILAELESVLNDDQHLRECCGNAFLLSKCVDIFVLQVLEASSSLMPSEVEFDTFFSKLSDHIYSQPFIAKAFSHLFNFHSEMDRLEFGNIRIVRLSNQAIAQLLGEQTPYSFLHPFGGGEFFVLSETVGEVQDDLRWAFDELYKAEDFARVLQYYKDGVVHVNYTSHYFLPEWVNTIRKSGIFVIGPQRKLAYEMGKQLYTINQFEYEELMERCMYLERPEVAAMFGDNRNKLGKAIEFGGTYFESSHLQTENVRRLIDLAIALEAIFHPDKKGEITFQLSQLAAQFIGEGQSEKAEIYADIKKMYGKRSDLFHGNDNAQKENFLTTEEIERWTSLIRRALVRFITLYLRGEKDHRAVIDKIRRSIFDPKLRRELRLESDPKRFAKELFSSASSE